MAHILGLGLSLEQIAERRKGIGGSDAKRVMDGDWPALWREKTGRAEPEDLSGVLAVQMGTHTEALNALWYERQTGRVVRQRNTMLVSKAHPFMRANLDGVVDTREGPAYWDAKHVGQFRYQELVLRYTPQMEHCCAILGYDRWVLSVLIRNGKWEAIEAESDPLYRAQLIAREREFWSWVERDEEPPDMTAPIAPPTPAPRLRKMVINCDFGTPAWAELVDRHNWIPEMATAIGDFHETDGAAKRHAIARETIKGLLPDDVGEFRRSYPWGDFVAKRARGGAVTMVLDKGE